MKQKVMYWLLALACWCSSQAVHAQAPGESAIWALYFQGNYYGGGRGNLVLCNADQSTAPATWKGKVPTVSFRIHSQFTMQEAKVLYNMRWIDTLTIDPTAIGSGSIYCKQLFSNLPIFHIEGQEVLGLLVGKAKDGDISSMFQHSLKQHSGAHTLDVSSWNTAQITKMDSLFAYTSLQVVDASNWNTSQVTSMSGMFQNCNYLQRVHTANWNTAQVTDMSKMFQNCSSLTQADIAHWNTSQVTTMEGMFQNCRNLTTVNAANWNTAQVSTMQSMFQNCPKLTTVNADNWHIAPNASSMFQDCQNLTALNVSGWNTAQATNMGYMFNNCQNLTALNASGWNTAQVTNMGYMFNNCQNLTALNASGWNTAQVTNMGSMFSNCQNLTALDVSGWNTEQVTKMEVMFSNCQNLTALDVSGWNTAQVTNMGGMFQECQNLTALDVSGWNTEQVTKMGSMFKNCQNLTALDVSGWNTEQVTDMTSMFEDCRKLETIDTRGWTGQLGYSSSSMFRNTKITSVDLSGMRPINLTTAYEMFKGCENLISVNLSGWGEMPMLVDLGSMFDGCYKLETVNMSGWKTNARYLAQTFRHCYALRSLDLSGFEFSTNYLGHESQGGLFHTFNLQYIDLRHTKIRPELIKDLQTIYSYDNNITGWEHSDRPRRPKLIYAPIGMELDEDIPNVVTTTDGVNYTCKTYVVLDERKEFNSLITAVNNYNNYYHPMPPFAQNTEQVTQLVNERYPKYVLNIPIPFTAEKVVNERFEGVTTTVGDAYTWHMPCDAPIPANVKAYEYVHNTVVGARATFRLTSDARLQAQKPYILVPTSGTIPSLINSPCRIETYTPGSDIVVEGDGWDFVGTFKRRTTAEAAAEGLYALQPENIWRTYQGSSALPSSIRAYLKKKGTSGGAATLSIVFEDGITSINSASNDTANAPIYDLSGRYVGKDKAQLPKGLYIVGGQKIAIP